MAGQLRVHGTLILDLGMCKNGISFLFSFFFYFSPCFVGYPCIFFCISQELVGLGIFVLSLGHWLGGKLLTMYMSF